MPQPLTQILSNEAMKAAQPAGGPAVKSGSSRFDVLMQKLSDRGSLGNLFPQAAERLAKISPLQNARAIAAAGQANDEGRPRNGAVEEGSSSKGVDKLVETLSSLNEGQLRMDRILEMSLMGRRFSPNELLIVQAQVYRITEELELMSKVVEKGTQGIQTTFRTQLS